MIACRKRKSKQLIPLLKPQPPDPRPPKRRLRLAGRGLYSPKAPGGGSTATFLPAAAWSPRRGGVGRAVGFQALRSPAAPLSRGQLGYCSSTQGGPQASGRGKRGPAAFALPRVCPGTLPAATLQGCGQARCLAKAGGGVLPRPYAVTPRSQSRLLAPPRFWASLSHSLWPPLPYLEAALLPPLWSRVAAGGPTRLLLSVPHLLIPNCPLSAGQMSPLLHLQAQGVCLEQNHISGLGCGAEPRTSNGPGLSKPGS